MYAFRGALIGDLLKEALSTSLLTIEDVFLTGLVREKAEVGLIHLDHAIPKSVSTCQMRNQLMVVTNTANNMKMIHNHVNRKYSFLERFINCWFE